MTVLQTTMAEGLPLASLCSVKLIAAEDECRQILFEILGVSLQLFGIRLLGPRFLGRFLLHVLLLQVEFLIF